MYARQGDDLVVLVGRAAGKTWWHSFRRPYMVHVRLKGIWHEGIGRTVPSGAVISLLPDGQPERFPEGRWR